MALAVSQMVAVSYNAVLNDARKPANQWAESALLRELQSQGGIKKQSFGPAIETTLDYQRNQGTEFLANDLTTVVLSKTEVLTAASYTPAQLSAPVTWSKMDEVQNPTENQKIDLVDSLLRNGFDSHDDVIEQALFAASATNGFGSLLSYFSDAGTGSVAGIDSSSATWWRNQQSTYVDDTDIEAAMTTGWNSATKGSGSPVMPSIAVSDSATQALFEGTQQANQRWNDTQDLKAGFKTLMFKTARYVFSQYGGTRIFMFSPKTTWIAASKEYFRAKGDVQEIQNQNGYTFKIYSALQLICNNRSRVAVIHV